MSLSFSLSLRVHKQRLIPVLCTSLEIVNLIEDFNVNIWDPCRKMECTCNFNKADACGKSSLSFWNPGCPGNGSLWGEPISLQERLRCARLFVSGILPNFNVYGSLLNRKKPFGLVIASLSSSIQKHKPIFKSGPCRLRWCARHFTHGWLFTFLFRLHLVRLGDRFAITNLCVVLFSFIFITASFGAAKSRERERERDFFSSPRKKNLIGFACM